MVNSILEAKNGDRRVFLIDIDEDVDPSYIRKIMDGILNANKPSVVEPTVDKEDIRPEIVDTVIDIIAQTETWADYHIAKNSEVVGPGYVSDFYPNLIALNFGRMAGHTKAVKELVDAFNDDEEGSAYGITMSRYSSVFTLMDQPTRFDNLESKVRGTSARDAKYIFVDYQAGGTRRIPVDEVKRVIVEYFRAPKFIVLLG